MTVPLLSGCNSHRCLQSFLALLAAAADGNVTKLTELLQQPHYAKHINSTDEEQRCRRASCCTHLEKHDHMNNKLFAS